MTRLNHEFGRPELLAQALTHRSAGPVNNERLEFLGDSVLGFIISDVLYRRFPKASEGDLSRLRARLVRGDTLARVAEELGIGEALILGIGEKRSGGNRRKSILADAVEAILGAIFLDAGLESCRDAVDDWFSDRIDTLPPAEDLKDAKTRLQEYLQGRQIELPIYELISASGADHEKTFLVAARVPALDKETRSEGRSRRKAEQAAAASMLELLRK